MTPAFTPAALGLLLALATGAHAAEPHFCGQPTAHPIDKAQATAAERSGGVPRLLNRIAHQALRLAAEAGQSTVEVEAVLEALDLLGLSAEETSENEEQSPLLGRSA